MPLQWVAGLFQGDNQAARGLSGGSAHTVALDDSNPYYNYRLRRHKAEGDLIADTGLLWYTSPYVKRRSGLGTHVGAEIGEGTANYTDVLLILSQEDFARNTPEWEQGATRSLQQEFENFCRRENFSRLHAHRPLAVRVLEDGSPATGGRSLGLGRGEFITGLLPNLYTGPVRGSYPVIGVHVNLPGVWDGYQEVGRLYNDQILFTLGSHWLDNFSHPLLEQSALYRLRQYPDGSFVHIVNPDLQDQYQVASTNQGGASVLTLATRAGLPLAYLVLAVIDPPSARPPRQASTPGRPDIRMPELRAPAPQSSAQRMRSPAADSSIPSIAPPMLIDEGDLKLGGKTIIPDAPVERIFTLQERGALLQRVHFSAFMLGYDVYMGMRGELGTHVEDPAATFQIRKKSVALVAHVDGVLVGGRPVTPGQEVPIGGDLEIEVAGQTLEYRDLRGIKAEGWPYVGEIRRPASSTYMIWGEDYQIGRSRECRVVLPDETRNENIHWKPSVGDGAKIRARSGEIRKSRFYTDSIMVASEHAQVKLSGGAPQVTCTARHCYVYVRRGDDVSPLYPTTSPQDPKQADLAPGDEILIGNCLFHVGYSPDGNNTVEPGPAPLVELTSEKMSSESLSDLVVTPNVRSFDDEMDPPSAMSPPSLGANGPIFAELEEEEEEPTVPGLVLPHNELDRGPSWDGSVSPEGAPERVDGGELSLDSTPREAAMRDTEDWSEDDSMPRVAGASDHSLRHLDAKPPGSIPAPFPNVADDEPSDLVDLPDPPPSGEVVVVDDAEAQFELGRRMHLILAGWSVNGEVVCGNHNEAHLVIPENRISADQTFTARDYFRLRLRGRKGALHVLKPSELLIDEQDPMQTIYEDPVGRTIDVIRRDDNGEEDFSVRLSVAAETLPDPRAQFVAVDYDDGLAAALVTRGLPLNQGRTLSLGVLELTLTFDGERVTVSDYLDSYKRDANFHPFFLQQHGAKFRTVPEDGAPFVLSTGDRMVIGAAVYVLRQE